MAVITVQSNTESWRASESPGVITLLVFTACAAGLSIVLQGYYFGIGNNIFHIPIALRLYDDPTFANDVFIQSLRSFASAVWWLVRFVTTESNIQDVFFILHFLSRWLLYVAISRAGLRLGLRSLPQQVMLVAIFAITDLFRGPSIVGKGELQVDILTHSEIGTPLVIFALLALLDRRLILAFVLAGVAFCVNAFIGVWLGFVLAFVTLLDPARGELIKRIRSLVVPGLAMVAIALPLLIWIAVITLADRQDAPSFDYGAFLRGYYPNHYFIQAATAKELVALAAIIGTGVLAALAIPKDSRTWLMMLLGFVLVFAIGIVVPFVTSASLILNLHLLRVDSIITVLAALFVASWAVRDLLTGRRQDAGTRPEAVILLAAIVVGWWPWIFVAALLMWRARQQPLPLIVVVSVAALGWLCALLLGTEGRFDQIRVVMALPAVLLGFLPLRYRQWATLAVIVLPVLAVFAKQVDQRRADGWFSYQRPYWLAWQDVQQWARGATAPSDVFMIPIDNRLIGFQIGARRVSWVSYREGATVMWQPKTLPVWQSRVEEQRKLADHQARLDYAAAHGIAYLVEEGDVPGPAAYRNKGFTVFAVKPAAGDNRALSGAPTR